MTTSSCFYSLFLGPEGMENLTEQGHQKKIGSIFCEENVHELHHNIFLASFNIFLSVTASLGNVLILIALHKESSLHPPSKLMFRCLAVTDICVGLITQPMFAAVLLFQINGLRNLCVFLVTWTDFVSIVFSGVSLMTVTVISVDRLLALSLGLRYRQVVTVRRVGAILICSLIVSVVVSLIDGFWGFVTASRVITAGIILCLITSVYCYTKIFLRLRHHQVQMQADHTYQGQPNGGGIPLNIARYRKTVYAALWVQTTLVAFYLPHAFLIYFLSGRKVSVIIGFTYTSTLVLLNSTLNPFLYCWKIREVRQAVKNTRTQFCSSN